MDNTDNTKPRLRNVLTNLLSLVDDIDFSKEVPIAHFNLARAIDAAAQATKANRQILFVVAGNKPIHNKEKGELLVIKNISNDTFEILCANAFIFQDSDFANVTYNNFTIPNKPEHG